MGIPSPCCQRLYALMLVRRRLSITFSSVGCIISPLSRRWSGVRASLHRGGRSSSSAFRVSLRRDPRMNPEFFNRPEELEVIVVRLVLFEGAGSGMRPGVWTDAGIFDVSAATIG